MNDRACDLARSLGLLILRLGIGLYLLAHGWGKLQMIIGGKFDAFMDPIGLGTGTSLVLAGFAEFICGGLLLLGLATRLAAIPVVITMAVAAIFVHGADPWLVSNATNGSKEPALLYLIPALALIFTGPGRFAVDAVIWRRWRDRRAGGTPETAQPLDQSKQP
jgi:putative oxidoreductase